MGLVVGTLVLSSPGVASASNTVTSSHVRHASLAHHVSPRHVRPLSAHVASHVAAPRLGATPHFAHLTGAHTYVVDTNSDPVSGTSCVAGHVAGTCSLRAAIAAVNTDSSRGDVVNIASGRHIVLSQVSVITITNSVTINGAGASVNGDGAQIFYTDSNASVWINGLKLTGGMATNGGAIYCNSGALMLSHVTFKGNSASSNGGALYSGYSCQLWSDGSIVTSNTAYRGGGFYLYGSATIIRSTFGGATAAAGNTATYGAGIYNYDGAVTLTASTVSHNTSGVTTYGYGVGVYNDEVMDIVGCTIDHNTATSGGEGAGVNLEYVTNIVGTAFVANSITGAGEAEGAAIYDDGDTTSLTHVTSTDNTSRVTAANSVYGGAVVTYANQFDWKGGSVTGTVNGTVGASDYIEGGAVYLDGSHESVTGVTISDTTNNALPNTGIEGGGIYNNEYLDLSGVLISNTVNNGEYVYGGAFYNDDYTTFNNVKFLGTSNHGSYASGGYVYGGALYNDGDYMGISKLTIGSTSNLVDLASAPTPSTTSSYIYGGAIYNEYNMVINGMTVARVINRATGGHSYVYGGGLYSDDAMSVRNAQFVGVVTQADSYVYGGVFANYDRFTATNFTIGAVLVKVLGGADAGTPYADGSIIYSDYPMNLTNATIANAFTNVPSNGNYNIGIENESTMQLTNSTIANVTMNGPLGGNTWLLGVTNGHVVSLLNSIVAAKVPNRNCSTQGTGAIVSMGYNIDSGHSCHFSVRSDHQNTNPMVATLANNGGMVLTAALLNGSPAIDGASNSGSPLTDARGALRPQGKSADIGAFEVVVHP